MSSNGGTVGERGGNSTADGMPEKEDGATAVMAEEGGERPEWDTEQVGCLVPFFWEVRRVIVWR